MKIAAFCRVSSRQQEKDGASLEVQQNVIKQGCEIREFQIAKWYVGQESATRTTHAERPMFDLLLADAARDLWDGVMVYDVSRATRTNADMERLITTLRKHRKKLFAGGAELPIHTAQGRMVTKIQGVVAEGGAADMVDRAIQSKLLLAEQGHWPLGEHPTGRLVVRHRERPDEFKLAPGYATLVKQAYKMIVDRHWSLEKTRLTLGINSAQVLRKKLLASGGKAQCTIKDRDTGQPRTFTYDVPTVLDAAQLARLQQVWSHNRLSGGTHNGKRQYQLAFKLRCQCGAMMLGTFKDNARKYVHDAKAFQPGCIRSVHARVVEVSVFRLLGGAFKDREALRAAITAGLDESNVTELQANVAEIKRQMEAIGAEWDKALLAADLTDRASKAHFKRRAESAQTRYVALQQALDEAEAELRAATVSRDQTDRAAALLEHFVGQDGWNMARWFTKDKQLLLDFLFGEGTVRGKRDLGIYLHREKDGKLTVEFRTPLPVPDASALRDLVRRVEGKRRIALLPPGQQMLGLHPSRRCRSR